MTAVRELAFRGSDRIKGMETHMPGSSCPKHPTDSCRVAEWLYEMESVHPRMYGECSWCGTVYAVVLPRQMPGLMSDPTELSRPSATTVVIDAGESTFRRSGFAQRLWWLLNERPIAIQKEWLREIEDRLGRKHHARWLVLENRVGTMADLLLERLRAVEELQQRLSSQRLRGAAIKALEAARRLREQVKRERPELDRIRAEARACRDRIAAERAAARREPLPRPAGYMPPQLDAGAVLCDALTPTEVVYALVDPADPELVRYVGRTCDPVMRYRAHCTAGTDVVAAWAAEVSTAGRRPAMVLLERCDRSVVEARERHWIRWYRDRYQADLNRVVPR